MTQWGARFTWRLPRLPRPPFCKLACQMNWTVINWTVVLRFSTENVRCLRKNWPSDPTNLGSLWGGVQHVYMTSWTLLGPERWSEATKKLHLDWRENMVSLPFKVPSQNELFCLVQSQTIFFIFKYYPRGQPMYYNVCYFLPNWSIPF